MLKDMKLGTRLSLSHFALAAIVLLIGLGGGLSIKRMQASDRWVYDKTTVPLGQLALLQGEVLRAQLHLARGTASADAGEAKERYALCATALGAARRQLDGYQLTLIDATDASNYQQMKLELDAMERLAGHVKSLREQGRAQEAEAYVEGKVAEQAERLTSLLMQVTDYNVRSAQAEADSNRARADAAIGWMAALLGAGLLLAFALARTITRGIVRPMARVVSQFEALAQGIEGKVLVAQAIAGGDLSLEVPIGERLEVPPQQIHEDEIGDLLLAANHLSGSHAELDGALRAMSAGLRAARDEHERRDWLKSGGNELANRLRGDLAPVELCDRALAFLCGHLGAALGALAIYQEEPRQLEVVSRYAGPGPGIAWERYQLGQGVLGQAALERRTIVLEQLPADYPHVTSALGEAVARVLIAVPLVHDGALAGAVELCLFRPVRAIDLTFLEQAQEALAIALSVTRSRQQVRELLVQSQAQEEELRVQQEELQQSNEELEERSNLLEEQREEIRAKNLQVEAASAELRQRAEEVQRISTYKSAFLANMSHELRTPLNSMMVLSSLLRDNKDGNLTARQVEFARTIHGSGRDLLDLINDILDLAKIESGRMEFQAEPVDLTDLAGQLRGLLEPLADQQGIGFQILLDPALPATLEADRQRLQQILKNLAANAVKFTAKGAVTVTIAPAGAGNPLPVPALAFAVADTGIGIAPEQLQAVFQAFRQADGTTSRKYGGTGLGLSISQQLATGMGGTIQLRSELGQGSTFTLYLPLGAAAAPATAAAPAPAATGLATSGPGAGPWLADDRALLKSGERAILIIEDDRPFAELLMSLVRDRGFKALAARDGAAGVELADSLQPSAIILDVMLPGMDGWTVMEQLRQGQRTRAIPVHFLTCQEDPRRAMAMGAAGFTSKPVTWEQLEGVLGNLEAAIARTVKRLLIVADDEAEVKGLTALLEARQVVIQVARTGAEAIRLHAGGGFDCVVLDLGLGDPSGFQVLEAIRTGPGNREVPVIIHSGRELAAEEERRLQPLSDSIIIKGAKSPERLLSEVTLFLHALGGGRSRPERARPAQARPAQVREAVMAGKKVLIVDDDMRNVFSLSSVFAEQDLEVLEAENGRVALAVLDAHPDLDLVLMDIMMPEMDGFEAMRRIRQDPRFRKLPIIALTAKAMKSDQEACLQAGASDYLTKPLDVDKLLSLMRVWLFDRA